MFVGKGLNVYTLWMFHVLDCSDSEALTSDEDQGLNMCSSTAYVSTYVYTEYIVAQEGISGFILFLLPFYIHSLEPAM